LTRRRAIGRRRKAFVRPCEIARAAVHRPPAAAGTYNFAHGRQLLTFARGSGVSMRSVSNEIDLDFTQAAPAAAPKPAPKIPAQAAIGRSSDGNFIAFARGGARRSLRSAADAPIVVVEDDPDTRRLLERVLTLHGFPVRTAADIDEFKQVMRPPLPRLVLLDIELPRVNGLRILSALRQHPQTAALPVVMVTARSGNKDLAQALSLGADGYVTKPLTVAVLRSVIDKVLLTA
jgi:CheY-like chemotaxis protein